MHCMKYGVRILGLVLKMIKSYSNLELETPNVAV